MKTDIELHGAFVWDCDECGAENFERAIEGDLDEAAMAAESEQCAAELLAIDAEETAAGEMEAPVLITRISTVPSFVKCKSCGTTFPTTVPVCEDDA